MTDSTYFVPWFEKEFAAKGGEIRSSYLQNTPPENKKTGPRQKEPCLSLSMMD